MNLWTKIENKLGWLGIGHLPLYIAAAQALTYVWIKIDPEIVRLLVLIPQEVVYSHQYWRLLTSIFVIPDQNPLFAFFYLYLIYVYGSALEQEWGSFRFTAFYLLGVVGTVAAAFFFGVGDGAFYLNTSLFLAFAALHPNFELLFFFILPLKIKWLAWLTWIYFIYIVFVSPSWSRLGIPLALLNYFVFFTAAHLKSVRDAIQGYQHRQRFKDWPRA
jgi:membrane associated rhomboid family serine protease